MSALQTLLTTFRNAANAGKSGGDYNLSVSSYVEAKDKREVVDITELNAELKITVAKIDKLRTEIDAIVLAIEGAEIDGVEIEGHAA